MLCRGRFHTSSCWKHERPATGERGCTPCKADRLTSGAPVSHSIIRRHQNKDAGLSRLPERTGHRIWARCNANGVQPFGFATRPEGKHLYELCTLCANRTGLYASLLRVKRPHHDSRHATQVWHDSGLMLHSRLKALILAVCSHVDVVSAAIGGPAGLQSPQGRLAVPCGSKHLGYGCNHPTAAAA